MSTSDALTILYGDLILIRTSGKGAHFYVKNYNYINRKEKLSAKGFYEDVTIDMADLDSNIHQHIFQLLPGRCDTDEQLFEKDMISEDNLKKIELFYSKKKVEDNIAEIIKSKKPVVLGDEVKIYHPYSSTFLSYEESNEGKKPGEEETEAKWVRMGMIFNISGGNTSHGTFRIINENKKSQSLTHDLDVSFELVPSKKIFADKQTRLHFWNDDKFLKILPLAANENKQATEEKHEKNTFRFYIEKYLPYESIGKDRLSVFKKTITALSYFRFVTNINNKSYLLSVFRENEVEKVVLIPKSKDNHYFCQTVFQLKESDLKKYRKGRHLPIYRLPLDSSEIDEKYNFRSEMQYALHLPFYRFCCLWKEAFDQNIHVDKQYSLRLSSANPDELEVAPLNNSDKLDDFYFTLINNIDDEQGEEDDMENLCSDTTTFFLAKVQKNFAEAKYITNVFSSAEMQADVKLTEEELSKVVGGEEDLKGAFVFNSKNENLLEEEKKDMEISMNKNEIDTGSKPPGDEVKEKEESEAPESTNFKYSDYCYRLASKQKKEKLDSQVNNNNVNEEGKMSFQVKTSNKDQKEFIEVKMSTKSAEDIPLEFKIEVVEEESILDCERLIALGKAFIYFSDEANKESNKGENAKAGEFYEKLDFIVEQINYLLMNEDDTRQFVRQNQILYSEFANKIAQSLKCLDQKNLALKALAEEKGKSAAMAKNQQEKENEMNKKGIPHQKGGGDSRTDSAIKNVNDSQNITSDKPRLKDSDANDKTDQQGNIEIPARKTEGGRPGQSAIELSKFGEQSNIRSDPATANKGQDNAELTNQAIPPGTDKKKKDPVFSFFDNFFGKKPFGNDAPQIWGTEKINEFLEQAKRKEIQNLCKKIIDKNNYFVSLIGISEMGQLWKIFFKSINETREKTQVDENILTLEIHITVLNTIYKNISTHSLGLGLNTFLNYRVNKMHIKPAILQIEAGSEANDGGADGAIYLKNSMWRVRVDKQKWGKEAKINKEVNFEEKQRGIMINLLELSYHVLRNKNSFYSFKFSKRSSEGAYGAALSIVKNEDENISLRSHMLEYISTVFFNNSFVFPEYLVMKRDFRLKLENLIEKQGAENLNEEEKSWYGEMKVFKQRIKDMLDLYNACLDSEKRKENFKVLKVIVQKKLFFFGNEEPVFFFERIKKLTEAFSSLIETENLDNASEFQDKDTKEFISGLQNTLFKLCDSYTTAVARDIIDEFRLSTNEFDQTYSSKVSNLDRKLNAADFSNKNPRVGVFFSNLVALNSDIENVRQLVQIASFTVSPIDILERIGEMTYLCRDEDSLIVPKLFFNLREAFRLKFKLQKLMESLNEAEEKEQHKISLDEIKIELPESINDAEQIKKIEFEKIVGQMYSYLLNLNKLITGKEEDEIKKNLPDKGSPEFLTNLRNDNIAYLRPIVQNLFLNTIEIDDKRKKQIIMTELGLYKELFDLFMILIDRVRISSLETTFPIMLLLLRLLFYFMDQNQEAVKYLTKHIYLDELFLNMKDLQLKKLHHIRVLFYIFVAKIYQNMSEHSEQNEAIYNVLTKVLRDNLNLDTSYQNFTQPENIKYYFCQNCWGLVLFTLNNIQLIADGIFENKMVAAKNGEDHDIAIPQMIATTLGRLHNNLCEALYNGKAYLFQKSSNMFSKQMFNLFKDFLEAGIETISYHPSVNGRFSEILEKNLLKREKSYEESGLRQTSSPVLDSLMLRFSFSILMLERDPQKYLNSSILNTLSDYSLAFGFTPFVNFKTKYTEKYAQRLRDKLKVNVKVVESKEKEDEAKEKSGEAAPEKKLNEEDEKYVNSYISQNTYDNVRYGEMDEEEKYKILEMCLDFYSNGIHLDQRQYADELHKFFTIMFEYIIEGLDYKYIGQTAPESKEKKKNKPEEEVKRVQENPEPLIITEKLEFRKKMAANFLPRILNVLEQYGGILDKTYPNDLAKKTFCTTTANHLKSFIEDFKLQFPKIFDEFTEKKNVEAVAPENQANKEGAGNQPQAQQQVRTDGESMLITSKKLLDDYQMKGDLTFLKYQKLSEQLYKNERNKKVTLKSLITLLENLLKTASQDEAENIILIWENMYAFIQYSLNRIEAKFSLYKLKTAKHPEIGGENKLQRELIYNMHEKFIHRRLFNIAFQYLQRVNDIDTVLVIVKVLNLMMCVKNISVQKEIYNQFVTDEYNTSLANLQRFLKMTSLFLFENSNIYLQAFPKNSSLNMRNMLEESYSGNYLLFLNSVKNYQTFSEICLFFKNICEGHFLSMQKFLFEQSKINDEGQEEQFNKPILFVEWIVNFVLESYIPACHPYNFDIPNLILSMLTEIVQGDLVEQIRGLCQHSKLIENLFVLFTKINAGGTVQRARKRVMKRGKQAVAQESRTNLFEMPLINLYGKQDEEYEKTIYAQRMKINLNILQLLYSLIEISDFQNKDLLVDKMDWMKMLELSTRNLMSYIKSRGWYKEIKGRPDFHHIEFMIKHKLDDVEFPRHFLEIINLVICIYSLEEHGTRIKLKEMLYKRKKEDPIIGWVLDRPLQKLLCKIEVVDPHDDIKIVYFPKYTVCNYLIKDFKDRLLFQLDRSSYETKIGEFFGNKKILHAKMQDEYNTHQAGFGMKLQIYFSLFVKFAHILITLTVNGMLLGYDNDKLLNKCTGWEDMPFLVLVCINLGLSVIQIMFFAVDKENYYAYINRWEQYNRLQSKIYGKISLDEFINWVNEPSYVELEDLEKILHTHGLYNEVLFLDHKYLNSLQLKLLRYYLKMRMWLVSPKLLRYCLDLIFSALSIYHPVFNPILLFVFILNYKIIEDVFRSFYKNWKEFGMTFLLGLSIMLIYAFIGYFHMRYAFSCEGFSEDEKKAADFPLGEVCGVDNNLCTNIWHCFLSTIQYGFRSGGGVGDVLAFAFNPNNYYYFTERWFYDLIFYALIIVVMLNLIFGIIIDTFSSIRERETENHKDQISKCFICAFEKGTIDQKISEGFSVHVKKEHYMWNYIFYLVYLEKKGYLDLSSLETFIWDSYRKKKFEWLPYNRSSKIDGSEQEEKNKMKKMITDITTFQNDLKELTEKVLNDDNLNKRLDKIEKSVNIIKGSVETFTTGGLYDCTRNDKNWKSNKIRQLVWKCNDCLTGETYVCDFCSRKCHLGHNLEKLGFKDDVICSCAFSRKGCKSSKFCTFSLDKNVIAQVEHNCKTCSQEQLCSFCIKNCHKGHKTEKKGFKEQYYEVFTCKCSEHDPNCKGLRH